MNNLFKERILYMSLSALLKNQKIIMRHLGEKHNHELEELDELIRQCNGIIHELIWEEQNV